MCRWDTKLKQTILATQNPVTSQSIKQHRVKNDIMMSIDQGISQ